MRMNEHALILFCGIVGCSTQTSPQSVPSSAPVIEQAAVLSLIEGQTTSLGSGWTITYDKAHHKHGDGFAMGYWYFGVVSPAGDKQTLTLNSDGLPTERKYGSRYLLFSEPDSDVFHLTHGPALSADLTASQVWDILQLPDTCLGRGEEHGDDGYRVETGEHAFFVHTDAGCSGQVGRYSGQVLSKSAQFEGETRLYYPPADPLPFGEIRVIDMLDGFYEDGSGFQEFQIVATADDEEKSVVLLNDESTVEFSLAGHIVQLRSLGGQMIRVEYQPLLLPLKTPHFIQKHTGFPPSCGSAVSILDVGEAYRVKSEHNCSALVGKYSGANLGGYSNVPVTTKE